MFTGGKERVPPAVQRAGGGAEEGRPVGMGKRGAAGEDAGTGSGPTGVTGGSGEEQRGARIKARQFYIKDTTSSTKKGSILICLKPVLGGGRGS